VSDFCVHNGIISRERIENLYRLFQTTAVSARDWDVQQRDIEEQIAAGAELEAPELFEEMRRQIAAISAYFYEHYGLPRQQRNGKSVRRSR
jgi:hypothetical protein